MIFGLSGGTDKPKAPVPLGQKALLPLAEDFPRGVPLTLSTHDFRRGPYPQKYLKTGFKEKSIMNPEGGEEN